MGLDIDDFDKNDIMNELLERLHKYVDGVTSAKDIFITHYKTVIAEMNIELNDIYNTSSFSEK
jgi:hypothetical protein